MHMLIGSVLGDAIISVVVILLQFQASGLASERTRSMGGEFGEVGALRLGALAGWVGDGEAPWGNAFDSSLQAVLSVLGLRDHFPNLWAA